MTKPKRNRTHWTARYAKAMEPIQVYLGFVLGDWTDGHVEAMTWRVGLVNLLIAYRVALVPNAPPTTTAAPAGLRDKTAGGSGAHRGTVSSAGVSGGSSAQPLIRGN